MTISEAAGAWLAHLATRGLKDETIDVYCRDIGKFMKVLGSDKDLSTITVLRVNGYMKSNRLLKSRSGKPLGEVALTRSKRVCRMFLEWCVSSGLCESIPAGAINAFKH